MIKSVLLGPGLELQVLDDENFSLNSGLDTIHFNFDGAVQILEVARYYEMGDYLIAGSTYLRSYLLWDDTGYHFETRQAQVLGQPEKPTVFCTITLTDVEFDNLVEALQEYAAL